MSTKAINIEGSSIRSRLRSKGIPGGAEKVCCGGRRVYSKDYERQLKALKMSGTYKVFERGVLMAVVTV